MIATAYGSDELSIWTESNFILKKNIKTESDEALMIKRIPLKRNVTRHYKNMKLLLFQKNKMSQSRKYTP